MFPPSTRMLPILLLLLSGLSPALSFFQPVVLAPQSYQDFLPPPECTSATPTLNLTAEHGVFPLIPIAIGFIQGPSLGQKFLFFNGLIQAMWTAVSSYHPTALSYLDNTGVPKCFNTSTDDPPATDAANRVNRNTALAHAIVRTGEFLLGNPTGVNILRQQLLQAGLNPADGYTCASPAVPVSCSSPTAAACVGHKAAAAAYQWAKTSGWNIDGSLSPQTVNDQPYADYVGYNTLNSYKLFINPLGWQPLLETDGRGYFSAQVYDTPYVNQITPMFLTSTQFAQRVCPPNDLTVFNYKDKVDDMIADSASLNDTSKMLAEYFQNIPGYVISAASVYTQGGSWSLTRTMAFMMVFGALHDANNVALKEKLKYDAPRPMSMIRFVYGNGNITAYAGAGKGVRSMKANDWLTYIRGSADSEYPSGGACTCVTFAEWATNFLGTATTTGAINLPYSFQARCSRREPGLTPAANISGTFLTAQSFINTCKLGRRWAGLHFEAAVDAAVPMCTGLAKTVLDVFTAKVGNPSTF